MPLRPPTSPSQTPIQTSIPPRTLLPMVGQTHGNRSAVTCHLRCGDACSAPVPNTTETSYFRDVAATVLSRRSVVGTGGLRRRCRRGPGWLAAAALPAGPAGQGRHGKPGHLPFTPIAPVATTVDSVTVPAGYRWDPIIRWGDPILPGAPAFDGTHQTPEAQAGQFGYNNDYLDIIETNRAGTARAARVQPRVHQRGHHVRARHRPGDRDPHGLGRARHVGRRAPAPPARRRLDVRPRRPPQPPDHPRHPVRGRRPGRRVRPAEDGGRPDRRTVRGHDEQLRRRHDAVGHGAVG